MRSPYRYDSNGWLPPAWLRWIASVLSMPGAVLDLWVRGDRPDPEERT